MLAFVIVWQIGVMLSGLIIGYLVNRAKHNQRVATIGGVILALGWVVMAVGFTIITEPIPSYYWGYLHGYLGRFARGQVATTGVFGILAAVYLVFVIMVGLGKYLKRLAMTMAKREGTLKDDETYSLDGYHRIKRKDTK